MTKYNVPAELFFCLLDLAYSRKAVHESCKMLVQPRSQSSLLPVATERERKRRSLMDG